MEDGGRRAIRQNRSLASALKKELGPNEPNALNHLNDYNGPDEPDDCSHFNKF
jgi:hypothetical protein